MNSQLCKQFWSKGITTSLSNPTKWSNQLLTAKLVITLWCGLGVNEKSPLPLKKNYINTVSLPLESSLLGAQDELHQSSTATLRLTRAKNPKWCYTRGNLQQGFNPLCGSSSNHVSHFYSVNEWTLLALALNTNNYAAFFSATAGSSCCSGRKSKASAKGMTFHQSPQPPWNSNSQLKFALVLQVSITKVSNLLRIYPRRAFNFKFSFISPLRRKDCSAAITSSRTR